MISIITPTHRPGPLLDITLKSVLEQTYSDWEWVVLDNSKDFYFESYLREFLDKNQQYKQISHKIKIFKRHYNELNIGRLKNECVRLTSCQDNEYVLLLDHDDFLNPDTLYEIHKMSLRYPSSDYITGDCIKLDYDVYKSLFYIRDMSDYLNYTKYTRFISGELSIHIGDFNLCFPYIENYKSRYYMACEFEPQVSDKRIEYYVLNAHPRTIKKQILMREPYNFYEGHSISEDSLQIFFLTNCLKGCYIEKDLYYNVCYFGGVETNSSFMPISDECKYDYDKLVYDIKLMEQHFLNIYPNLNLFDSFLNKHELSDVQ